MGRIVALVAVVLTGSVAPAWAVGEPQDGFPSWAERVVEVWVNRARADPATELAACSNCAEAACYTPAPPMAHVHELARAARFHSANLASSGCGLAHDSPCVLVADIGAQYTPGPCDGNVACACEGGTASCSGGTAWSTRVGMFGAGPSGENAAAGTGDPVGVFYLWLYEPDSDPACGFRFSNGHRYNILGSATGIGVGNSGGHWTQDFGGGTPASKIVAGAHYPDSDGSMTFRANWYDPAGAEPTAASVNIEALCTPLAHERGVNAGNSTWMADVQGQTGCRRYYFIMEDAAGVQITYPETGTFAIGCGDGVDWTDYRPGHCDAQWVDAGTGPGTPDAAGGGPGDPDAGGGGPGGDDGVAGGCGCRAGGSGSGSGGGRSGGLLLLVVALACVYRRPTLRAVRQQPSR